MKAALLVLVLLVHTVHSLNYTRLLNVEKLNDLRRFYAKGQIPQIANTNELEYNPELEKVIYAQLALTGGCPKYQYISTDSHDIYLVGEGSGGDTFATIMEGASRTEVAIVTTYCSETQQFHEHLVFAKTNAPDLYGPAGSKCPEGRKATAKGLCAREKKTD
ncbi:hypothetical protein B9Z55_026742 [Caenorhabditis nigoni]|uniref:Uncharacterized protein n=1 Tax=Caenorhabditis nigoni TaxID=1611254 RepID=A0A2G5SH69_9PELO|nr:hypothetical protein B9Z55_026742 [Caenorhabditis nigoni]